MPLDFYGVTREFEHILVRQGKKQAIGLRHFDIADGRSTLRLLCINHLDRLGAELTFQDRLFAGSQRRLENIELVGIHGALNDILAQAIGGGDKDDITKPGLGVERKHHTGGTDIGAHHFLRTDRKRHILVRKPLVHAVGNGAVVEERGVNAAAGRQQVLDAAYIKVGVLLPRERGVR